jgi:NTE family protein
VNVFDASGHQTSRYRLTRGGAELAAGREFDTWGEGRVGYRRETGTADLKIGAPAPDVDVDIGEAFVKLSDDKLDNLYFPRHGHIGTLEYRAGREGMGSTGDYDQVVFNYTHAFSWGANTVIGSLNASTTLDDNAPLERLYRLGGFLRLSGLQDYQLTGQQAGLASVVFMRRIQKAQFLQSYIGASLELGGTWQSTSDVSYDSAIVAGSLFLGADTPIGPLYIAYGRTDRQNQSAYVYLGPRLSL